MQQHILLPWDLRQLKQTLLIAELIKTYVSGHWQDNKTAIILVRRSLSVPLYQGCFLLCGVARTYPATQEVPSTTPPFSLGPHLTRQWWKLLTVYVPQSRVVRLSFEQPSSPFPFLFCFHCSSQRVARCTKTALTIFPYARLVKMLKTWPFSFFSHKHRCVTEVA